MYTMLAYLLYAAAVEGSNVPHAHPLSDDPFELACGPIAAYVSLRWADASASLQEVARECDWAPGKGTTLHAIAQVVRGHSLDARVTRMTPGQLIEHLSKPKHSVMVVLPKGESKTMDHLLTVVEYQEGMFIGVEYPWVVRVIPEDELRDIWDGVAIRVGPRSAGAPLAVTPAQVFTGATATCAIAGAFSLFRRRRRADSGPTGGVL